MVYMVCEVVRSDCCCGSLVWSLGLGEARRERLLFLMFNLNQIDNMLTKIKKLVLVVACLRPLFGNTGVSCSFIMDWRFCERRAIARRVGVSLAVRVNDCLWRRLAEDTEGRRFAGIEKELWLGHWCRGLFGMKGPDLYVP